MFYLPGCLFFADWEEKRRREKGARGSAFAARGGVSGRPPERSRRRAHRRPSRRPPPGLRLPSLPPLPAPPARSPDTDLAAGPLPPRVGQSVRLSRRTPLGTRRLLPLLPQRHQQPRSGPSPVPAPSTRPVAPGPAERGARAVASARGTAPGPAPSPPTHGAGRTRWGPGGGPGCGWWSPARTCG